MACCGGGGGACLPRFVGHSIVRGPRAHFCARRVECLILWACVQQLPGARQSSGQHRAPTMTTMTTMTTITTNLSALFSLARARKISEPVTKPGASLSCAPSVGGCGALFERSDQVQHISDCNPLIIIILVTIIISQPPAASSHAWRARCVTIEVISIIIIIIIMAMQMATKSRQKRRNV